MAHKNCGILTGIGICVCSALFTAWTAYTYLIPILDNIALYLNAVR